MIKIALFIALYFAIGVFILNAGIQFLSKTLLNIGEKHIKPVLLSYTKNTFSSFLSGFTLSVLLQGSTPVMLCTISLIHARMMSFYNSLGIIYGANLGTTLSAVLMSYSPRYSQYFILALGLLLKAFLRKGKLKYTGDILLSVGLIYVGIGVLNLSMPLFREQMMRSSLWTRYADRIYVPLILSVFITAVTHSSAAVTAVTILLFKEGIVGKGAVIAIILGSNLGTCITAQIASFNTEKEAVKMAWANTMYNLVGCLAGLVFLNPFHDFLEGTIRLFRIPSDFFPAVCHIVVNLLSAIVFIPLTKPYYRFINKIVGKGKQRGKQKRHLLY
ncbi:MAG: Na/Pi cotransporter family protein [Clostridia bacterium]|jgi:phosphate:Na+ symporter